MCRNLKISAFLVVLLCVAMPVQAQEKADSKKEPEVIDIKSLLFSDKEVERIRQAQESYANRETGSSSAKPPDFDEDEWYSQAGEIKQARSQDRYFTYPQFFLESLVFHTDVDWTIWINGQRITPAQGKVRQDIKVTAVDKNQVSVQWRPVDFDKVRKTWAKSSNESVHVDESSGLVSFTLKPNQTFSSYAMRVLEGKVMPVTVDYQVVEKEFKAKQVISEKNAAVVQELFSDKPEDKNIKANDAADAALVATQSPTEIIGIYEIEEQKKNDTKPTAKP